MQQSIALARLPDSASAIGDEVEVEIRDKRLKARSSNPYSSATAKSFNYPHSGENHVQRPANLKYAASHEWAKLEADGTVTIGITDHAQEALGDIVFLELPEVGRVVKPARNAPSSNRSRLPPTSTRRSPAKWSKSTRPPPTRRNRSMQDAYAAWLFKIKPDNAADLDATARRYCLQADAYAA
jgi:glycine cleavage system H protein